MGLVAADGQPLSVQQGQGDSNLIVRSGMNKLITITFYQWPGTTSRNILPYKIITLLLHAADALA